MCAASFAIATAAVTDAIFDADDDAFVTNEREKAEKKEEGKG